MQPIDEQILTLIVDELEIQGKERFRDDLLAGDTGVLAWIRGSVGASCRSRGWDLPTDWQIDRLALGAMGITRVPCECGIGVCMLCDDYGMVLKRMEVVE